MRHVIADTGARRLTFLRCRCEVKNRVYNFLALSKVDNCSIRGTKMADRKPSEVAAGQAGSVLL